MNGSPQSGGHVYYLTDILGASVSNHGKKIGRLADVIIHEQEPFPEVAKLYVRRSFGKPSLLIPWEKVKVLKEREIVVSIEDIEALKAEPQEHEILLKDHILDKKVLDMEDREVEIVYDVKLLAQGNKLLITDVNISRYRFLRRVGPKWLANLVATIRGKGKDQKIPWSYVQPLPTNISSFKGDVKLKILKETLSDFHPADLADILEELDRGQRVAIFNQLEPDRASDTLEEINPNVQRDLVASLHKERAAQLINPMTSGQAADVLSVLPHEETRSILQILKGLNPTHANKIEAILNKQEERIGNFTTGRIFKRTADTLVADAREYFNRTAKDMEVIMYLYVTDENDKLIGVMDLKELLQARPDQTLKDVMIDNIILLHPNSNLKEALELFSHYDFRAIPVVDEQGKLLGAIPFRDVMKLKHRFLE